LAGKRYTGMAHKWHDHLGKEASVPATNYENISIHGNMVKILRKIRSELSEETGRRITLTETLQVLINNYYKQDAFAFLDLPQNTDTVIETALTPGQ
jgi:hypothetical protein